MKNFLVAISQRLRLTDRGASGIEYALVISLLLVGSIGSIETMDDRMEEHYSETASSIGHRDLTPFEPTTTLCGSCPTTTTTTTTPPTSSTTSTTSTTTTAPPSTTSSAPEVLTQTASQANASGSFSQNGSGWGVPNGNGNNWSGANNTSSELEFTFTVTTAGFYKVLGSVNASGGSNNSFWVTINGTPSNGYLWDTRVTSGYQNDYVSDRNGQDPVTVWLEPGDHTVTLHKREDGTYVQSLELVPV